MKLSKQLEKEIREMYIAFWDSYMQGNKKKFFTYLNKIVRMTGTTEGEDYNNKVAVRKFIDDTHDQVVGKVDFRNRKISISPLDSYYLIYEQMHLYVLVGSKWTFYAKVRISAIVQKDKTEWKFIQLHASIPDAMTEEGETIAMQKISKENLELREAVRRRTVELENKNWELEIETALEKVRAIALGMKEPADMPDVCKTISLQLQSLGVKNIRNVQTAIFYESRGTYMNYEYYAKHKKTFITETVYTDHKVAKAFAAKMLKGKGEFFITHIKGQKVKDWLAYQKSTNVFIDRFLEKASSLSYYWHSLGPVALGISTYSPLNKEELNLFNRFLNVFELAYRRYLDIEQALVQTKEARIELALERVRARAMSMQKSEELKELIGTVFTELTKLDLVLTRCLIMIYDLKTKGSTWWMANSEAPSDPIGLLVQNHEHAPYLAYLSGWEKRHLKWQYILEGTDKKEWDDFLFAETALSHLPDFVIAGMKAPGRVYLNASFNSFGNLTVATLEPLSNEHFDIMLRFAKVFDLTYTRFNDLLKAEAQAREAQIELSLERVRTRTMIMQKSEELVETSVVLFQELRTLGVKAIRTGVAIIDDEKELMELWSSQLIEQKQNKVLGIVPMHAHPFFEGLLNAWRQNDTDFIYVFEGEKVKEFYQAMSSIITYPAQDHYNPREIFSPFFFPEGSLTVVSHNILTNEERNIMQRFARVFGLLYRRFHDLQKAEAQAREAQIEAALERVRARSMAMHKTDELLEAAELVSNELSGLGIISMNVSYAFVDENEQYASYYSLNPVDGKIPPFPFVFPHTETDVMRSILASWKKQEPFHVIELDEEATLIHQTYIGEHIQNLITKNKIDIPFSVDAFLEISPKKAVLYTFNFKKGYLFNIGGQRLTTEQEELLLRFTKVFEQTYTRFLDLQKAEAQAREAQIENALEKVRSRTMAMQRSEELPEAANNLFLQVQSLGIPAWSAGYCVWDEDKQGITLWMSSEGVMQPSAHAPCTEDPSFIHMREAYERGDAFHVEEQGGEALVTHYKYMRTLPVVGEILDSIIAAGHPLPTFQIFHCVYFSQGFLLFITYESVPEAHTIFKRFTNVFEQTYTRFLDLQKAEAQAREGKIETALERVRSRTMGMQKSEELKEVIQVVYAQFVHLNIHIEHTGFIIDYKVRDDMHIWLADRHEVPSEVTIPYFDCAHWNSFIEAKEKGLDFFANQLSFEEKNRFYQDLFKLIPGVPEETKEYYFSCPGLAISTVLLENVGLYIENFSGISYSDEENATLMRFGKVFQQTYTRFLDLQKAEAQAREANIEAALERTRTHSMLMQHSNELDVTSRVFHEQLLLLGIDSELSYVWLPDVEKEKHLFWATWNKEQNGSIILQSKSATYDLDRTEPYTTECFIAWESGEPVHVYHVAPAQVKHYFDTWSGIMGDAKKLTPAFFPEGLDYVESFMKYGCFGIIMRRSLTDVEKKILHRFTIEFERTYTRFLDLQKAEEQTRESNIELALERVRARTMAMQKSEELGDVATLLFKELNQVVENLWTCGFVLCEQDRTEDEWWLSTGDGFIPAFFLPNVGDVTHANIYNAWKNGETYHTEQLEGAALQDHYDWLMSIPVSRKIFEDMFSAGHSLPAWQKLHCAYFSYGYLVMITKVACPEEEIFKRFARVFDQTYTRFLDLQKAEAQAREATIEAALEKVRGKAMAMHNSNDLTVTASMVFAELRKLNIYSIRSGVGLLTKESRKVTLYAATSTEEGDNLSLVGWSLLQDHEVLSEIYDSWIRHEDYFPVLKGELLKTYYEKIKSSFKVPDSQSGYEQYGYFLAFSEGCFYGWSEKPYTETEIKILNRFKMIIDLTFRRYIELQKSESNARDAVRRASLDRVRAETSSMRTTADLERITPLIWSELTTFGVPFIRCGVFIMDEQQQQIHTFLSTPDGKAIAAFHLPYTSPGTTAQVLEHWRKKKMYKEHWDESAFLEWTKNLVAQGAIAPSEKYVTDHHPTNLDLHFLPFLQGMLYVGSETPLSDEELQLVQNLADAFSTAYARYEDFNRLEAAKEQIENTLINLKQTQAQLVQSEKMASLGELTAGIAHEIQNPLNFVNNFSEVSTELLDEMLEEVAKGNYEEVKSIVDDIKQNLEKINHHGKRADGIVKGMLQHSRSSSGEKVLTDLNALADEYLRLAFHGLRAKDKSFNAGFKTDFDSSIGKVEIIPQDIGRVLVNLINNAFYAVNEKRNSGTHGYEPMVTVSTKKVDNRIEVRVTDNGNGIPKDALDKVFQPFFTTKPTGQGTGLGLSLSYDIIKAHGGQLNVVTEEGKGSEFIISLPVF